MSALSLKSSICTYISETLLGGMAIASDDELLLTDLIDSLAVVRLVAHLEETYAITIQPEDVILETMQTVDAMAEFLMTKHGVSAS